VEFLIAKNNVILTDLRNYENGCQRNNDSGENNNYDFLNQSKQNTNKLKNDGSKMVKPVCLEMK
jgi:hypothetical protein